jgi:hypothetical protein
VIIPQTLRKVAHLFVEKPAALTRQSPYPLAIPSGVQRHNSCSIRVQQTVLTRLSPSIRPQQLFSGRCGRIFYAHLLSGVSGLTTSSANTKLHDDCGIFR